MNIICESPEQTRRFAIDFASTLKAGDVVLFSGDLGSGKTFICSNVIKYFCSSDTYTCSPTFNILQTYSAKDFSIYHFDLYRLKHPSEIFELGIEEACDGNICLIEWPEIAIDFLPQRCIKVNIRILGDTMREISILRCSNSHVH